MREYISVGSSPSDESPAQVGSDDYRTRALAECHAFIGQLRRTLGPEPAGAQLRVKAMPHDFGTYHEVVCYYDTTIDASTTYAFRCESHAPAQWDDTARAILGLYE